MATRQYSDEQMLKALQRAASIVGEPMSTSGYESVRSRPTEPMWRSMVSRFGSWNAACAAAGLATTARVSGRAAVWDEGTAAGAVKRFLADPEQESGSYLAYTAWAKRLDDAPSGASVKNIFGTWNVAKSQARLR